jgi:glycosyltransferase involved in cell wall biosynthesis
MVTSLFKITEYLATKGHSIDVLAGINASGETKNGVRWLKDVDSDSYDVLVCNRGIGDGYPWINAKKRILWTHDLPHTGFAENPKALKIFTTVFMSKYAERVWRAVFSDIGESVYIPNGVDKSLFYPREKDYEYLIYFSHPNRGLKKLPLICDAVATRTKKQIKFHAYSNAKVMYPNDTDERDHGSEFVLGFDGSERLRVLNPIPQPVLSEEVGKAGLMIMPTGYPEICSNNVLQSLASGTPIITTGNIGSSREWIKHGKNGMLTEFSPNDYMIHSIEIVRHICKILEDRKLHRKLINGAAKTKIYDWSEIGRMWDRLVAA